jgi:hypothetical protein
LVAVITIIIDFSNPSFSPRNKSGSPRNNIPTHHIFGKQYGQPVNRGSGSQQRKIVINSGHKVGYSSRSVNNSDYPGIMNNTMTGGFAQFNVTGTNKLNISGINKINY